MKIFISWSGARSQILANSLSKWLKPILHFSDPWLSSDDILSGERWNLEVAKNLQDTNFGVLCVTSDNMNAPWLLFEAGALAKSIQDGRVVPLLLDLEKSELSGPLTQFQAEKADRSGIRRLAESLNKAAPLPIDADTFSRLFDALWPDLEKDINNITILKSTVKRQRPQAEVLEELVAGIRGMEMHIRDIFGDNLSRNSRKGRLSRAISPRQFLFKYISNSTPSVGFLLSANLIKDDAPWFYEMCREAYSESRSSGGHLIEFGNILRAGLVFMAENSIINQQQYIIMSEPFERFFNGSKGPSIFHEEQHDEKNVLSMLARYNSNISDDK